MDFNHNIPIYCQIIQQIKQDTVLGRLKPGQKMPSVREMAGKLKVNPNTVQRAYLELERENIVFTKRGMGTYLTKQEDIIHSLKKELSGKVIRDFLEGMNQLEYSNDHIMRVLREHLEEGRKINGTYFKKQPIK